MQGIINEILKEKVIVIVRGEKADKLLPLAKAMYEGGIRLMEITYNAEGAPSDGEIAASIEMLAKRFNGRMLIGAGTVTRKNQVELTKRAGGRFIISPDTNPEIIKYTKDLGLVSIPGAMTPSEITLADRSGADFVKLFPAFSLGSSYIKAIKAPLSNIRLLAVGSVNLDNMAEYFKAGVCGLGTGHRSIAPAELYENEDYTEITKYVKDYIAKVKSL